MAREAATTWTARLDLPPEVELRPIAERRKTLRAGPLMLVPNGRAFDVVIRAMPEGGAMTVQELRAELARCHGADITCSVTTGICVRTVAEAAHEAFRAGTPLAGITPVWCGRDARASTPRNVAFDPAFILEQRAREASFSTLSTG